MISTQTDALRTEVFSLVSDAISHMTPKPAEADRHGVAEGFFDQHTRLRPTPPPRRTPVPGVAGQGVIHTPSTPILSTARSSAVPLTSPIAAAGMRNTYVHTTAYNSYFMQYGTIIFVAADESMMNIHDPYAQYQSVRRVVHEHITMRRVNPDRYNLGSNDLAYALKLCTEAVNVAYMCMHITIDMNDIEDPTSRSNNGRGTSISTAAGGIDVGGDSAGFLQTTGSQLRQSSTIVRIITAHV
jgi:hypothetical protein